MKRFVKKMYSSSQLTKSPMVKKIVEMLDNSREYNYDLDNNIPSDLVSIELTNILSNNIVINIPRSVNDSQYIIEDLLYNINPACRLEYINDRDLLKIKIKNISHVKDIYKIIKEIINKLGYIILINK